MLTRRKVNEEVMKEILAVKEARKKLEGMLQEVEDLKGQMKSFDYGMSKVVKVLAKHDPLIDAHNEGIIDLDNRLEKLEKPDKKEKEAMAYQ